MKGLVILSILILSQGRLLMGRFENTYTSEEPLSQKHLMFKGFVEGMSLDITPEDLLPCIKDLGELGREMMKAIAVFESGSLIGMMKGIKAIEHALKDLPSAVEECANQGKNDYLRLKNSLQALKHPVTVEFEENSKFKINGIELIEGYKNLMNYYSNQKWYQFGFTFGSILAKVCGSGFIITA